MASGRELCYLLLAGIFCCYLMAIPILAAPTVVTCTILRIGLGLCLSLCYSAILTKTNRISRIFNRGAKGGIKRPSYTSPKSQIVICCGRFTRSTQSHRISNCIESFPFELMPEKFKSNHTTVIDRSINRSTRRTETTS